MYCKKCGNKIKEGLDYCQACGNYINNDGQCKKINVQSEKNQKIFKNTVFVIVTLINLYIVHNTLSPFLYIPILKYNIKNELSSIDYKKISYKSNEQCTICIGSCDGSCFDTRKEINCYKYIFEIELDDEKVVEGYVRYDGLKIDTSNLISNVKEHINEKR